MTVTTHVRDMSSFDYIGDKDVYSESVQTIGRPAQVDLWKHVENAADSEGTGPEEVDLATREALRETLREETCCLRRRCCRA